MANVLVDNFESYTAGALNGQGSWAGDTTFAVETSVVNSGTKAVSCTNNGEANIVSPSFTGAASAVQKFAIRMDTVNNGAGVRFRNGTTSVGLIGLGIAMSNVWEIFDNIGSKDAGLGAPATNTWYQCRVEWDIGNSRYRLSINDGVTFSNWFTVQNASNPDNVSLIGPAVTATVYFDDFAAPAATTTSNPHLLSSTGVGA